MKTMLSRKTMRQSLVTDRRRDGQKARSADGGETRCDHRSSRYRRDGEEDPEAIGR